MDRPSYFFSPNAVLLNLTHQGRSGAVEEVSQLLKQDPRVTNWQELLESITALSPSPLNINNEHAVVIYHARTNHVQDLVMAAGRSPSGIFFEESEQPVHLIIVIGIPHALNQEYLRILGSLARSLKEPSVFEQLLTTECRDTFIKMLSNHDR